MRKQRSAKLRSAHVRRTAGRYRPIRIDRRGAQHVCLEASPTKGADMITEKFDPRTLAKMEAALERACTAVPVGEQHEARRHIALRIMERAQSGDARLEALTE